jgi:type IV secretory pathway VirB4 component
MPGYVDAFAPLRKRPPGLHRLVPWKDMVDESLGLMSTKDDGFLCCAVIEPPDLNSLSEDEQWAVTLRLNEVEKLLTPGSGIWHHLRHRPALPLPPRQWSNPLARLVDDERRAELNAPGASWVPTLYLSLYHRTTPASKASGFSRYFMRGPVAHGPTYGVQEFAEETEEILTRLSAVCPSVHRLVDKALPTYLHSCVSVHDQPLWGDELGLHLDILTSDCGLWRGMPPVIGDASRQQYVRSVTLYRQFPAGTETAIFRQLHRLPFAWDKVSRWLPKSRTQAQQRTDKLQVNWLSKQKGLRAYWYEARTGDKPDVPNTFLAKQATDVDMARDRVLSGDYDLGPLAITFLAKDDVGLMGKPFTTQDMARVNGWIGEIARVVRAAGCSVIDDPVNQMENFVGTWPGKAYANIDTLEMTSLNFATLALSHAPWKGIEYNAHLKSPPLIYAKTEGCHRIGVDTYVGDQGDAIMPGPKGSGKSTALGFFDLAWLIESRRHLAHFDVGGSCRCTILCAGGQYHDLAKEVSLQIMADLDRPEAVPWIFGWLKRRVHAAGVPRHPDVDTFLWGGLDGPGSLRAQRDRPRMLTEYLYLRQLHANKVAGLAASQGSDRMRELSLLTPKILGALRPFAQGGAYGHLTDAPVDRLHIGRVHGFELETLLTLEDAYSPVLEIIFFRLKAMRDGSPTKYVFDEASHCLNTDDWVDILKVEIPTWRRENASGLFAAQSISQFRSSKVASLLEESALTRFYLPNAKALDGRADDPHSVRSAYLSMGLGEEEIRRNIVMATPKAEMYWTIPDDRLGRPQRRLIDLRLGPIAQAICGANTKEDHQDMDELLAKYPAEEFAMRWLTHKGFPEAAQEVATWRKD